MTALLAVNTILIFTAFGIPVALIIFAIIGRPEQAPSPQPEYFESGNSRAHWVTVLLTMGALERLVSIASTLSSIVLVTMAGSTITKAESNAVDFRAGFAAILTVAIFVSTVILFLLWIHRAHSNLYALGVSGLRFTSGWVVGYWFIPILNFFRPYQVVKEIWNGSDPNANRADASTGLNAVANSSVIGWWWAAWLLDNFLGRAASRYSSRTATPADSLVSTFFDILSDFTSILAAILAIRVVRAINAMQEEKSRLVAARNTSPSKTEMAWLPDTSLQELPDAGIEQEEKELEAPVRKNNRMAALSRLLIISGIPTTILFLYLGVPLLIAASVTGVIAYRQIQASNGAEGGKWMAIVGIAMGFFSRYTFLPLFALQV